MAFTGNTIPFKTEWIKAYQETHYKQPIFPVFADQRFADVLVQGATVKWTYDSDSDVQQLGIDGSYTVANKTVTDESLTVNKLPTSTFRIPAPQRIQDHRPTQAKWAAKAMNRIFWNMDANMLGVMQSSAGSLVDNSQFGGSAPATGEYSPITANVSNSAAIFAACRRTLRNQNIIYDENKKWSGYTKLDKVAKYPACAIPAELEEQLLLAIGFKPGDLGDTILTRGYMNMLLGFNVFYSGALPFTCKLALAGGGSTTVQDADTVVIGGVTFTFKTSLGATAGNVLIGASDNAAMTNLFSAINSPYANVASTSIGFTRSSLTLPQAFTLDLISATNPSSGVVTVTVLGQGTVAVTRGTATSPAISQQAVHAIFGTSQSISLIMQRYPELAVSPDIIGNGSTGGFVARDYVTWTLAGWNVFKTQVPQLIDVPIAASTFTAPANLFN